MTVTAPRHPHHARALSLLYEAEIKDDDPLQVVAALRCRPTPCVPAPWWCGRSRAAAADRALIAAAVGWQVDRMPVLDRIVLRLAVAELLDPGGPPVAVVIDEAVELVKEYSTDESGGFVNGILSAIAHDLAVPPA